MVKPGRSVNLTTLFLDRLRPPKRLREKQTDKNESGSFVFIESGSKMAVAHAP